MAKIERKDIHIITRHSNWSEKGIQETLEQEVYNNKTSWHKFLRLFLISLGIGFSTAGIIFFFAYNWTGLHKFVKLGLIEGLIIASVSIVLFSNISRDIKNIMLTGSAVLVGVLFAVFGQVYQTGANAYDFFLGWTVFIILWALVSNFAPLWLLLITLINTTLVLYSEQVAYGWSEIFVISLLFLVNTLFLIGFLLVKKLIAGFSLPVWFSNLLALACVFFSTVGISKGVFDDKETSFFILLIITLLFYALGIKYGLHVKSGFYLSIIAFSIIIMVYFFLLSLSEGAAMYLFIGLFVIISVTGVIKKLIDLQRKWIN